MQHLGSKILPADPYPLHTHTPTLGIDSNGQISTCSEHDHVVYQSKENPECRATW